MKTTRRRLAVVGVTLALSLALLVLVVVPIAVAILGPSLLRSVGVFSDDLSVHISTGPGLLVGQIDELALRSGSMKVKGLFRAGDAHVDLHDVSLTSRTFGTIDVSASDLTTVFSATHEVVHAESMTASGPANDVTAVVRFSAADLTAMLTTPQASGHIGFAVTGLQLGDGFATLKTSRGDVEVGLAVDAGGDLVLRRVDGKPDLVVWAAVGVDAKDWRLDSGSFDASGATITAHFDVPAFIVRYPSLAHLLGGFAPAS